jgi:Bacteriophage lambda head decoration protein D
MDLSVRKDGPYAPENFSWLGSKHGVDSTDTITLNTTMFNTTFGTQGFIPSGVALGLITAAGATQGTYGPYDNTATDGRQTMAGHLMTTKSIKGAGARLGAAILNHGKVRLSKLPAGHGVDAAGQADVAGRIIYIA